MGKCWWVVDGVVELWFDDIDDSITLDPVIIREFSFNPLEPIREVLESISCLASEGPEFLGKIPLYEAIQKEAQRGLKIMEGK